MTDSAALPPEFLLRYGDCVVLEVAGIEGCEFGGLLGSEDSRASSEKFVVGTQSQSSLVSSNRRSSYLLPVSKKSEHEEADARYLGVSAIKEYNGQKKLPDHFFMQNVFQIAYGVGFEAPGQFVRYGSHIRLVLKSTKEFLHANRQSDLLELTSSRSEVTHLKECTFKIFPRYQVRTDGEYVYYKDLIVLQDLLGRDVYCTSAKTVTLNSNPQQKTGFKLVKFLSYELATNPYLTGGSTVQLYHKEESCFIIASNMKDGAVNIDVYNSDTTLLESSSSYWQIETLPRSHREAAVTGVLHHGTPCRLRHIILELYLVIKNGDMALSKEVGAEADFELLLNFDDSDSSQDILSNVPLAIGSPLRLRNKASGLYVSIDKDIKEEKKFASCSHTDSHKDVFMLLAAPDQLLDAVVQVKKFKHGFSSIVSRLRLPGLTKVEFSSLVSKAIHHLEVLLKGGNVLGQLISSDEESSVTKTSYDICNELGLTTVLLDVADCGICALEGSHDSGEDTMQESTLARAAYAVLAKMVSKNVGSVYAVVKYGGVSKMISHLIKLGSSANWTPPLLELVDTLYSVNGPELHNYLNVLTPHDIEILLDAVYHRLFVGDVPDEYFYRLLARICKPGNGLITTTKGVDFVNRNMQLLVCQHVLGSPLCDHHKSPFWSLMTYRTVLHQVAPNRQPEVLISTSNAGQFRPMGLSGTLIMVFL
ncbi:hypothetical protein EON65_08620 [archaeon]|nr:MAG: hypothetical protein EON65_08620 [archaeon]